MAEIVSRVSEKIKNVANATAKKTRSVANITKYAIQMKSLNHDLKRMYEKLGAAYYANVMLDEDNDELVATRVSEINEVKSEIERLSKEIKKEKEINSKKNDGPIEADFQVIDENGEAEADKSISSDDKDKDTSCE